MQEYIINGLLVVVALPVSYTHLVIWIMWHMLLFLALL